MPTAIHRLRIRSPEGDAHAVATRVAAQLNAADLSPAALPPGATLVVRRIGSGLPPWRMDPRSVRPPAEWQAAVSQRLDSLLRRAVRGRRGAIPEDAEAVLFLDEADLLAAMALDWMSGSLLSHWCWQSLFPHGDLITAMLRTWVDRPECVPPAMERLVEARRAGTFVQRLPEPVLESIVRGVIRVFALRHLEPVFETAFHGAPLPAPPEVDSPPMARSHFLSGSQAAAPVAHLQGSVAPVEPGSSVEAAIQSTPGVREAFLLELAAELQRAPRMVRSREWAARFLAKLAAPASPTFSVPPNVLTPRSVSIRQQAPALAEEVGRSAREPEPLSQSPEIASGAEATRMDLQTPASTAAAVPPTATSPIEAQRFEGVETQTELGGIFYLINLALYLGYYSDFSAPSETGIDLLLWDFLTQAGRELAGRRLMDDAVWTLLESLGEGEAWAQLEHGMVRIREWLTEAMGEQEDAGWFVLKHSARIRLTDTRLDIFLSLQELPVEIRIARLDRDPGWVPAAGRFVAFHFL